MSFTILEDGYGTGSKVKVDDHGRLYTSAVQVSHTSHHATYHKNFYTLFSETTLASDGEHAVLYFQNNDSTKDLEIHWARLAADANVLIETYQGHLYSSGGEAISPVNSNFGTPNSSNVVSYQGGASGDLVMNETVNNHFDGGYVSAYTTGFAHYDGAIVLPYLQAISFKVTGLTGNNIKLTVGYASHAAGTKL